MTTFLPGQSPSRRASANAESVALMNKGPTAAAEVAMAIAAQGDVRQNAWALEVRRNSQSTPGGDRGTVLAPATVTTAAGTMARTHGADGEAERVAQDFEDWIAVVEAQQGQLATAQQTDLSMWFHEERLAAKTPFAAVVPCLAPLRLKEAQENVAACIDAFAFSTFYVQTLPMGTRLSEVAQAFVRCPAHMPEVQRYRAGKCRGPYAYTTVACHTGRDAIELLKHSGALRDAVRDLPCLLLNDYCPQTPLCLRCLVVAGRCVAAEVACDEAFTPLFGIQANNTGADAAAERRMEGADEGVEEVPHRTCGERRRASAAARRRQSASAVLAGECEDGLACRTASDVVADALQRYVDETFGKTLGDRSYTAILAAEVKGFDPRALGPREGDPPFWPVMTREPLHLRASPFEKAGLRFYVLSLEYADPGPFEAFTVDELCAIGDYVMERGNGGMALPPVLRFLDGHEAERAAARPPASSEASTPLALRRPHGPAQQPQPQSQQREEKPAEKRSAASGNGKMGYKPRASSRKPRDASATRSDGNGYRLPSESSSASSVEPPATTEREPRHRPREEGDGVRSAKLQPVQKAPAVQGPARPQRPSPPSTVSAAPTESSAAPSRDSSVASSAIPEVRERSQRTCERRKGEDAAAGGTVVSSRASSISSGSSATTASSAAASTNGSRLPSRASSYTRRTTASATAVPVTGAETVQRPLPRHTDPATAASAARSSSSASQPQSQPRGTPSSAPRKESIVLEVLMAEFSTPTATTAVSSRRGSSVAASEAETGSVAASSHPSARLPERRRSDVLLSTASESQRSSVSRSDAYPEASSVRSSLPARRRSSAFPGAVASVEAMNSDFTASAMPSSTASSPSSVVASSRPSGTAYSRPSCIAADAVQQSVSGAAEEEPVMPLQSEDIPMVASPNLPPSIASSSVSSMQRSERLPSSYAKSERSAASSVTGSRRSMEVPHSNGSARPAEAQLVQPPAESHVSSKTGSRTPSERTASVVSSTVKSSRYTHSVAVASSSHRSGRVLEEAEPVSPTPLLPQLEEAAASTAVVDSVPPSVASSVISSAKPATQNSWRAARSSHAAPSASHRSAASSQVPSEVPGPLQYADAASEKSVSVAASTVQSSRYTAWSYRSGPVPERTPTPSQRAAAEDAMSPVPAPPGHEEVEASTAAVESVPASSAPSVVSSAKPASQRSSHAVPPAHVTASPSHRSAASSQAPSSVSGSRCRRHGAEANAPAAAASAFPVESQVLSEVVCPPVQERAASIASSAALSSRYSAAASSRRGRDAEGSCAAVAVAAVESVTPPPPLQPEDIPMVASPNLPPSIASSSFSSHAKSQASAPASVSQRSAASSVTGSRRSMEVPHSNGSARPAEAQLVQPPAESHVSSKTGSRTPSERTASVVSSTVKSSRYTHSVAVASSSHRSGRVLEEVEPVSPTPLLPQLEEAAASTAVVDSVPPSVASSVISSAKPATENSWRAARSSHAAPSASHRSAASSQVPSEVPGPLQYADAASSQVANHDDDVTPVHEDGADDGASQGSSSMPPSAPRSRTSGIPARRSPPADAASGVHSLTDAAAGRGCPVMVPAEEAGPAQHPMEAEAADLEAHDSVSCRGEPEEGQEASESDADEPALDGEAAEDATAAQTEAEREPEEEEAELRPRRTARRGSDADASEAAASLFSSFDAGAVDEAAAPTDGVETMSLSGCDDAATPEQPAASEPPAVEDEEAALGPEAAEDEEEDDHAVSTYYSDHTSVTGAGSDFPGMNSADFQSCISAAPSGVSSIRTDRRAWSSRPTSVVSGYAPPPPPPEQPAAAVAAILESGAEIASVHSSARSTNGAHSATPPPPPAPQHHASAPPPVKSASSAASSSTATSTSHKAAAASGRRGTRPYVGDAAAAVAEAPTSLRSQPSASQRSNASSSVAVAPASTHQRRGSRGGGSICDEGRQDACTSPAGEQMPEKSINTAATTTAEAESQTVAIVREDRDAALRTARRRAMAALVVASAAYEEVERVAAIFGRSA